MTDHPLHLESPCIGGRPPTGETSRAPGVRSVVRELSGDFCRVVFSSDLPPGYYLYCPSIDSCSPLPMIFLGAVIDRTEMKTRPPPPHTHPP